MKYFVGVIFCTFPTDVQILKKRVSKHVQLDTKYFSLKRVPSKTFQTPAKNKRKIIQEGRGATEVQHRTDHCSGFPFEVVDQGVGTKDQRHKCFICGSKTKWMCIKCRFYFCMDYKGTSKRDEGLVYAREQKAKSSSETIVKIYGKTCFHVAHDAALRNVLTCQIIPGQEDQSNKENENSNVTHFRAV